MNKLLYFLSLVPCLLFLECTPDYSFLEDKGFYCEKEEDCEKGWVCNKVKKICEKKEDVFEDVKVVEEEIFDFLYEEEKIEIDIKEEDVFEERVEVVEDFYEVMEEVEVKIPKLLCSPCITDKDCNEKGFELKCIEFDIYGRFCLSKCPCFEGYKCKDDYCYPKNGICKCTKEFEGKKTKCYKKNEYGKCFGDIKCKNEKFTLCGAPEPQKEICDDIDNNCNGMIDEGCGVLLPGEGEHCKKVDSEYKCAEGLVCKKIPVDNTPYYNCYKPCNTVSDCSGSIYENPPFNLSSQELQCFEMEEEDICLTGPPWPVDVQGDLCSITTVECQVCGVLTLCMSDAKFAEFYFGGGNFLKHCRKPCNSDSDCNGNRCLSVSNMDGLQTKESYSYFIKPPKKGFCCMSTDTASGCKK